MEKYLIEEYNVYESVNLLSKEEDIKPYFEDCYPDFFDCGQGYYEDEVTKIIKIKEKFYEVTLKVEICSAKQDRGERLFWVESLDSVTYKEIPKPLPKVRNYSIRLSNLTENEKDKILKFLEEECLSILLKSVDYHENR